MLDTKTIISEVDEIILELSRATRLKEIAKLMIRSHRLLDKIRSVAFIHASVVTNTTLVSGINVDSLDRFDRIRSRIVDALLSSLMNGEDTGIAVLTTALTVEGNVYVLACEYNKSYGSLKVHVLQEDMVDGLYAKHSVEWYRQQSLMRMIESTNDFGLFKRSVELLPYVKDRGEDGANSFYGKKKVKIEIMGGVYECRRVMIPRIWLDRYSDIAEKLLQDSVSETGVISGKYKIDYTGIRKEA